MTEKSKYFLFGAIGLLAGVAICAATKRRKEFLGGLFNFRKKKSPKSILFIGDSITADPRYSYPALIRKARPDLNIDVLAKGGQTTKWMADNLPIKLAAKNYDRVYIYGGVNDAFSSSIKIPDSPVTNVQRMIDLIRQDGAEAYVILGYEPILPFMDYRRMPLTRYIKRKEDYIPLIERYKRLQAAFSSQLKNTTLVPKMNLGNMTSDGTHPTAAGQQRIADIITKTI
jgi:lysophospholipase L1-like esterase